MFRYALTRTEDVHTFNTLLATPVGTWARPAGIDAFVDCLKDTVGGGLCVVAAAHDGCGMSVWNVGEDSAKLQQRGVMAEGHVDSIRSACALNSGANILTGSDDGRIVLWGGDPGVEDRSSKMIVSAGKSKKYRKAGSAGSPYER